MVAGEIVEKGHDTPVIFGHYQNCVKLYFDANISAFALPRDFH